MNTLCRLLTGGKSAVEWHDKGEALSKLGKYEEAVKCYDEALEINPNYAFVWNGKGDTLCKLCKYEEAFKCYEKTSKMGTYVAFNWVDKGKVFAEIFQYEYAINCYDKALQIIESDIGAWNNKGIALYKLGKYKEAVKCYDEAIKHIFYALEGSFEYVWYNKADALKKLDKHKEAKEYCDIAKRILNRWENKNTKKCSNDDEELYKFDCRTEFEFNSVEIRLEIIDSKTMLTHHTWIWDMVNTSDIPLNAVHYDLTGDVPRDYFDLHLKVTDGHGNRLELFGGFPLRSSHRNFYAHLSTPIKKNQKSLIKLEYDWEEPNRSFEYVLSSNSKKFKYFFTAPTNLKVNPRILETLNPNTEKRIVAHHPEIRCFDNYAEIVWETATNQKIQPLDRFRFQW